MKKNEHVSTEVPVSNMDLTPDILKPLPPLTEKQGKCLEFILNFFAEHRYYPTQREMAEAMGIKSNTAEMYLKPLQEKGYIQRQPGKKGKGKGPRRNIRLTNNALERLQKMGVDVRSRLDAA